MNPIESIQKKYLPGFYQSRFKARKAKALSLQAKCQQNPSQLSIGEVKIILKVLQQYQILPKQLSLEKKQGELRSKILQSSVYSTIVALTPFCVRQFYRWPTMMKFGLVACSFAGANYFFMRSQFHSYISDCRIIAHRYLPLLRQESQLPV